MTRSTLRLAMLVWAMFFLQLNSARAQTTTTHIFFDDFHRTTGLGSNWQVAYGGFTTDGTYAVSSAPPINGNWAKVVPNVGTADYSVSANLIIPAGSLYSGVVARSTDSLFDSSLYTAQLSTAGSVNLYRRNAWTWTLLSSAPAGIVAGTSYNLKLVVTGNSPVHLEVYVNGTLTNTANDASPNRLTAGACGIQNYNASVKYTNFSVDKVPRRVFFDSFARTTGLGSNWQVQFGAFTTDGTSAVSGSPPVNGNWAGLTPALGTNDYSVSADLIIPPGSLDSGVVARSNDPLSFDRNLYSAQIWSDGTLKLYRRELNWDWTLLNSTPAGIVANTTYNVKLVATGNNPVHLEVWLNGTPKIVLNDTSANAVTTGGNAGIENYNSGVKYKNFTVEDLSAPAGNGDVVWVNQINTTVTGTTIKKTAGADKMEDAGAASQQSIASGNATFQYAVDELTNFRFVGFGHTSTWQGAANIDFSFRMQTGHADVYESNVYKRDILVAIGDVLKIDISNGVASYYKNGVLQYTSTRTPTYPLYVITSMIDLNSTIAQANINTGSPAPPPNTILVSVSLTGTGSGSVASTPQGIDCPGTCSMRVNSGTPFSLAQTIGVNSHFVGWSGACTGTGTCSVTNPTVDQLITAQFDLNGTTTPPPSFPCGNHMCVHGEFPQAGWRPYDEKSPFNRLVPPGTQPVGNSSAIIARLTSDIGTNPAQNQPDNWLVNADGRDGWPTYYGLDTDPLYGVSCSHVAPYVPICTLDPTQSNIQGHALPLAEVQGNNPNVGDRHLTFIDQVNKREFDLWQMSIATIPSTSSTIPTTFSGYTWIQGGNCGAVCDGLAREIGEGNAGRIGNLAGRIRAEEMLDAVNNHKPNINHALTFSVGCTNNTGVYPADPNHPGQVCASTTNAPPMGAWIHLAMTLDEINALPVPEWKKILLRTLMYYGAYVNDTGAGGYFQWQLESGNQYISTNAPVGNPWMTLATTLAGQANSDWFACNPPDNDCVAGGYKGLFRDTDDFTPPDTWKTRVWQRLEVLPPPAH